MNILDKNIDEAVATYILKKIDEYKKELDSRHQADKGKLIEHADSLVEGREVEIREEYSSRSISKLQEKNEQIEQLEAQFESYKESLSEKVHTFLTNSKEEVRSLVEEEIRTDSEHLKAERQIDEIRAMVGNVQISQIDSVDEGKVARLSEDVEVLKERLEAKSQSVDKLKARLKTHELIESVPGADKEFYQSQMGNVQSVSEAEDTFARLKKATRAARVQMIDEDTVSVQSVGRTDEDTTDHSPRNSTGGDKTINYMKHLAGL